MSQISKSLSPIILRKNFRSRSSIQILNENNQVLAHPKKHSADKKFHKTETFKSFNKNINPKRYSLMDIKESNEFIDEKTLLIKHQGTVLEKFIKNKLNSAKINKNYMSQISGENIKISRNYTRSYMLENLKPINIRKSSNSPKIEFIQIKESEKNESGNKSRKSTHTIIHKDRKIKKFHKKVSDSIDENEFEEIIKQKKSLVIELDSFFMLFWNIYLFVSIIFSLMFVPVDLAFNSLVNFRYLEIVIELSYSLDIIFSCFIPFYDHQDELIKDNSLIRKRYFEMHFMNDLISAIPFQFLLISLNTNLSVFQLTRLLKILKFKKNTLVTMDLFEKYDLSSGLKRLISSALIYLFASHCLTCVWVFLSKFAKLNWVQNANLYNESSLDLYIASLYFNWTTIFTIGYGDIVSISIHEKIFNIFIMLFGILLYSYGVTSIGTLLASYDRNTLDHIFKLEILDDIKRSFPSMDNMGNDNSIDIKNDFDLKDTLYHRLNKYLVYDYKTNKKAKLEFINDLPNKIKNEVLLNMHSELVKDFSFFKYRSQKNNNYEEFNSKIILSMRPVKAYKGELIFKQGYTVDELIFVRSGILKIEFEYNNRKFSLLKLRKNDYYGVVEVLSIGISEVNVKVKSKNAELFLVKKADLFSISLEFPEIFKDIFKISSLNYEKINDLIKLRMKKIDELVQTRKFTKRHISKSNKNIKPPLDFSPIKPALIDDKFSINSSAILNELNTEKELNEIKTVFKKQSKNSENPEKTQFTLKPYSNRELDQISLNSQSNFIPQINIFNNFTQNNFIKGDSISGCLVESKDEIPSVFGSPTRTRKEVPHSVCFKTPSKQPKLVNQVNSLTRSRIIADSLNELKRKNTKSEDKLITRHSFKIDSGFGKTPFKKRNRLISQIANNVKNNVKNSKNIEKNPKMFLLKEFNCIFNKHLNSEKNQIKDLIDKLDKLDMFLNEKGRMNPKQ